MTLFDKLIHKLEGGSPNSQNANNNYSGGPSGPPPQVSPPWYAEWSPQNRQWLFINQQTGERTLNYPGPGYGSQQHNYPPQNQQGQYGGYNQQGGGAPSYYEGGPPPNQYYGGGAQGGYGQYPPQQHQQQQYGAYQQPPPNQYGGGYQQPTNQYGGGAYPAEAAKQKKSGGHGLAYGAAGAAAGLAGGMLLAHEGEKIEQSWDNDKLRLESDALAAENSAANFPSNAAYWTGQKVGEVEAIPDRIENKWDDAVEDVEDIPDRIENKWDNAVQDVEDVPEDIAGWAGKKVGEVERFDDNIDNAYDEGRDEGRYGGDDGDDY